MSVVMGLGMQLAQLRTLRDGYIEAGFNPDGDTVCELNMAIKETEDRIKRLSTPPDEEEVRHGNESVGYAAG